MKTIIKDIQFDFTTANSIHTSQNITSSGNIIATDITATGTITAQEFKTEFISSSIIKIWFFILCSTYFI